MRRNCWSVAAAIAVAASTLVAGAPPGTAAGHDLQVVVPFDAATGEKPEGVAIDKKGRVFVSFPFRGELRRIDPDGSQHAVAHLPNDTGFGPLGLAVDAPGNVYVAVATFHPDTSGVYRVGRGGDAHRLPGTAAIGFPNGLAFDDRGNLYVADSVGGAIWRIPRKGGAAELWLQHPLLEGDDTFPPPFPIGANGIAYRHRTLFVTNTEGQSVVRVPVGPKGEPGIPTTLATSPALHGADGIAIDVHGDLYVPVISQSTILRVDGDDGAVTELVNAGDGVDYASSVAFGTGRGQRTTLFAVNFSIADFFGQPPGPGPALVSLDVGVPGLPQP